jgi:predicted nucleic acid-binding Zn ribbon protein
MIKKRNFKSINCIYCGEIFIPITSSNKTCSKKCLTEYNSNKLLFKKCSYCGKQFKHKTRQTCSDKCYAKLVGKKSYLTRIKNNTYITNKGFKYTEEYKKRVSIKRKEMWKNGLIKPNKGNWKKEHTPWNKGLTKETDERIKKISNKQKGRKVSIETKNKISNIVTNHHINGIYKNSHNGGYYKNKYMKSSWEIKVAKWLDKNNIVWEYESKKCKIKLNNNRYYLCDFYLPELNKYIEVKGWWSKYDLYKCQQLINQKGILNLIIVDSENINNISLDKLFYEYTSEFISCVDDQIERILLGEL